MARQSPFLASHDIHVENIHRNLNAARCYEQAIRHAVLHYEEGTTIAESGIAGLVRRIPGGPYPHQYPMVVAEALDDPSMVAMRLRQELHARGVQTEEPYPVPAPIVEVCPNAASLRNRLVLLPVSAGYGDHVYRHVASALTEAARSVMVESGPE